MVMGRDSSSKGRGFECRHRILEEHFFIHICCKNWNDVCLERSKINKKRLWVAHLKKLVYSIGHWSMCSLSFSRCQC